MDLLSRINHTSFLGREFLTWLWYRSELQEGIFDVAAGKVEVWFDAKLVLETAGDIREQSVVKAETPTEAEEARVSLLSGKQVTEARLRVIQDQKQWTVTVKGETLGLSGLKIPALLTREDDDRFYERFTLLEEIEDILDALFAQFLGLRVDDDSWREEVGAMRHWVRKPARDASA